MKVDTNLSEEEFLDKMKSKGIKLAALSSYYHSSEKKKKYENIYVMNYSFVAQKYSIFYKKKQQYLIKD